MTEQERQEFGQHLQRLREERGLSLREVEKEVGISNSYLYQIEKGERGVPKPEVLQKLAAVYKVTFQSLMAAARLQEADEIALYYDRLDQAFDFVRRDQKYKFGTHMNGRKLTPEAKRFIIEMYQEYTGKRLLDEIELYPLDEEDDPFADESTA